VLGFALAVMLCSADSAAGALRYHNPLRLSGSASALSCPDPSVIDARRGRYRYYAVCTSDYNRDAFPIVGSHDLVHWFNVGHVFPNGHQPWWALASTGRDGDGRYWAPEIYRIAGRWVVYFAAVYNPARVDLRLSGRHRVAAGTMVIGVATSSSLRGGWSTRILHYRGQFNAVSAEQENNGGAIDPSVVRDPRSGQLYLFWAVQHSQIWVGKLSASGLALGSRIHLVLVADQSWEWDPVTHLWTIEAPEPFYERGRFYLLYSGASTWNASYAVAVAVSAQAKDSTQPFVEGAHPILRSGAGFFGPGHASHPIRGPDGNTYVLYHATSKPAPFHVSADRKLMLGRVNWSGGAPIVNDGYAR
jgi:beta-xylosidase